MNKRELEDYRHMMAALEQLGFTYNERQALRRISMTLHRWHERECGDEYGCIERDDATGKALYRSARTGKAWAIPDRESGARKRLDRIVAERNKPLWPQN